MLGLASDLSRNVVFRHEATPCCGEMSHSFQRTSSRKSARVQQLFNAVVAAGVAGLDHSAMAQALETLAAHSIAKG